MISYLRVKLLPLGLSLIQLLVGVLVRWCFLEPDWYRNGQYSASAEDSSRRCHHQLVVEISERIIAYQDSSLSGTFHRRPAQGFLGVGGSRWCHSLLISRLAGLGQIACDLIRCGGCQRPAASPTVQGHCTTCLVASFIDFVITGPSDCRLLVGKA